METMQATDTMLVKWQKSTLPMLADTQDGNPIDRLREGFNKDCDSAYKDPLSYHLGMCVANATEPCDLVHDLEYAKAQIERALYYARQNCDAWQGNFEG